MALPRRSLLLLLVAATAVVGLASSSRADTDPADCPPQLSGHWSGTWHSDSNIGGMLAGDIDALNNTFTGPFSVTGSAIPAGTMTGTINCDQMAGTFTFEAPPGSDDGTIDMNGTLSADGRTISARYHWDSPYDDGDFTINIAADPTALAVSDTSIFEGDTPALRVAYVPITLTDKSKTATTVQYRLIGITARPGRDYVELGTQTMTIAAGAVEATIAIPTIANTTREGDRTLEVIVMNASNGRSVYAGSAIVTIRDDD